MVLILPKVSTVAPPSSPEHEEPSPSQTPHSSSTAEPFGVPAQSAHDELSPPHTPHSSNSAVPPDSPLQSASQSLLESLSHTPQLSTTASPLGTPAQSKQVESSPPHSPHSSNSNVEPHVSSQPDGPGSKHPQPKSSASPPLQTPQLSSTASPPQTPAQSCTQSLKGSSSHTPLSFLLHLKVFHDQQ